MMSLYATECRIRADMGLQTADNHEEVRKSTMAFFFGPLCSFFQCFLLVLRWGSLLIVWPRREGEISWDSKRMFSSGVRCLVPTYVEFCTDGNDAARFLWQHCSTVSSALLVEPWLLERVVVYRFGDLQEKELCVALFLQRSHYPRIFAMHLYRVCRRTILTCPF